MRNTAVFLQIINRAHLVTRRRKLCPNFHFSGIFRNFCHVSPQKTLVRLRTSGHTDYQYTEKQKIDFLGKKIRKTKNFEIFFSEKNKVTDLEQQVRAQNEDIAEKTHHLRLYVWLCKCALLDRAENFGRARLQQSTLLQSHSIEIGRISRLCLSSR